MTPPASASTRALPAASAVRSPEPPTAATAGALEDHVKLTPGSGPPSASEAMALSWIARPTAMTESIGDATEIVTPASARPDLH